MLAPDFKSRPPRLTEHFSISYAGQLYQGRRVPALCSKCWENSSKQSPPRNEVRVRFYGPPLWDGRAGDRIAEPARNRAYCDNIYADDYGFQLGRAHSAVFTETRLRGGLHP